MVNSDGIELEFSILIVDVNRKRSRNLKYVLDGLYVTNVVDSVENAILYLTETKPPDIIISINEFNSSDNVLTDQTTLGGLDLCRYVKETENILINEIPLLILMETHDKALETQLFNKGVSDIIYIPYNIVDLFSRIELQLDKIIEKRKLFESMEELAQDMRVRSRKNIDFRTKLVAKHRDTILLYENKVKQLINSIDSKKVELESSKNIIQNLQKENEWLLNELNMTKSKLQDKKSFSSCKTDSLENLSENELKTIEKLFNYVNREHLFEEVMVKKISINILRNSIDFKKIDNFSFLNSVTNIIKKYIYAELEDIYKKSVADENRSEFKKFMNLLVDYIIKATINKFLFFLAMDLLEKIGEKDGNATKFLKFYDGRVEISPDGTRFQKPEIIDQSGVCNIISIMQIINQRTNGHKIIVEQKKKIDLIDLEFKKIEDRLKKILVDDSTTLVDDLKKRRPFEEKVLILKEILTNEKSSIENREFGKISAIDDKLHKLESLESVYKKIKNAKDMSITKYEKQIDYYKPTEEKFTLIALSLAKIMLKVKIIN